MSELMNQSNALGTQIFLGTSIRTTISYIESNVALSLLHSYRNSKEAGGQEDDILLYQNFLSPHCHCLKDVFCAEFMR